MSSLLIVGDDELLRDAFSAQLAQAGHTRIPAADDATAQALQDLGLPKVSGMAELQSRPGKTLFK